MENQNRVIQVAERGGIFEFIEKDGSSKNLVLVVSSNNRKKDKRVSTTMLGDSDVGSDVIELEVDNKVKFIHCGMISYSMRNRLGKKVGQVPDDKMLEIDKCIMEQLGLYHYIEKSKIYEKIYNDLVLSRSVRSSNEDKENW